MRTRCSMPTALLLTLLFVCGCGSAARPGDSSAPAAASHGVCFSLGDDWKADGELQAMFFATDGQMMTGMSGFTLHLSPYYLAIELSGGVDASAWLAALPDSITHHPAVKSVELLPSLKCEDP